MFDPHDILAQVAHNEVHEEWLIRHAKDKSREVVMSVGIPITFLLFPELIALTLAVPYLFGYSASNPLPLLLTSPWIILPALLLLMALVFSIWRTEKKKSDAVLILLPEGIVECEHWHNEKKHRIKSFEYAELEAFKLKVERGDISFHFSPENRLGGENDAPHIRYEDLDMEIHRGVPVFDLVYRDGRHEKWSVADKYLSQPEKGLSHLTHRIITDYISYSQRRILSQVRYEQASKNPKE